MLWPFAILATPAIPPPAICPMPDELPVPEPCNGAPIAGFPIAFCLAPEPALDPATPACPAPPFCAACPAPPCTGCPAPAAGSPFACPAFSVPVLICPCSTAAICSRKLSGTSDVVGLCSLSAAVLAFSLLLAVEGVPLADIAGGRCGRSGTTTVSCEFPLDPKLDSPNIEPEPVFEPKLDPLFVAPNPEPVLDDPKLDPVLDDPNPEPAFASAPFAPGTPSPVGFTCESTNWPPGPACSIRQFSLPVNGSL